MMIKIAMFNNKGGVGKTTLVCNLASYFSSNLAKRVLLVDCDPQCNSTQLVLGNSIVRLDHDENRSLSLFDVVQPIIRGDADIIGDLERVIFSKNENRFNIDLVANHPNFSIAEDFLSAAWFDLTSEHIGGIRRTNWINQLCNGLGDNYDVIFFDLGPSLNSINRCVLIACDYFVTPLGSDRFSIVGIQNISQWISRWISIYNSKVKAAIEREKELPGGGLEYPYIAESVKVANGYVGYTMQQYITRVRDGQRRAVLAYEDIMRDAPNVIERILSSRRAPGLNVEDMALGDVPHLYSLVPLSQSSNTPIFDLRSEDGLVGNQYKQRDDYKSIIDGISRKLCSNINLPLGGDQNG
jgi:cellulose biosynthesis protein BcsQ